MNPHQSNLLSLPITLQEGYYYFEGFQLTILTIKHTIKHCTRKIKAIILELRGRLSIVIRKDCGLFLLK